MFLLLTACLAASSTALCPYEFPGLNPWNSTKTWHDGVPQEGDQVTIRSGMKVLLNTSPPPLASITIEEGGALVWGNFPNLKLTVSYILVTGSFEIGSEDCRFQPDAFIFLTGKSNSQNPPPVPGFGRKFMGVTENGTLEFHGRHKLSWTKLIQTVPAATKTCGMIYNHRDKVFSKEHTEGLHVAVFNTDASLYDFQVFGTNVAGSDPAMAFESFVAGIPNGSIASVALNKGFGSTEFPERDWEKIYTTIEKLGGMAYGSSQIRNIGEKDAYAFITQKGQSSTTKEERATQNAIEGRAETKRLSIVLSNPDFTFNVKSVVQNTTSKKNDIDFRVLTNEVANTIIKLKDDVSTWKVGDQIVVTSTDFDWRQAEVFTIIPCTDCAENEVRVDHEFEHMHFGEITYGIDERAEVAMLSRNIKIEGQLEDECYANDEQEEKLCQLFQRDTFGGHFKVLRYFKSVHVQQVELVHMGQQRILGSYPLHFHMCDDADGAWLRDNSIHHSLARCITIHGTDGVEVKGNVCYLHLGHGFFLEDSAEVRNTLDGNIGIGTMPGTHLLSDMDQKWCGDLGDICGGASTFWLTHPHNYVRNNVAAGSDVTGFWYIISSQPLGPSKARQELRGIVTPGHAYHSRILEFNNNVAHSCGDKGLFVSDRISINETHEGVLIPENGIVTGPMSHDPRKPPNKNGVSVISYMDNFTAYKNRKRNVWIRGYILMRHFSIADSTEGMIMTGGSSEVYTEIRDSLFIGESDNYGEPVEPYPRSLPKNNGEQPLVGVVFYRGPSFVTSCHFDQYFHRNWNGKFRPAGALTSKMNNPYTSAVNNHVKNITFGFCDKTEGNWVFFGNSSLPFFTDKDGSRFLSFRDLDGSVTGHKNTQVVRKDRFFTTPRCSNRDTWNTAVCPHRYCKVSFSGEDGALDPALLGQTPMQLRRDDRPEDVSQTDGSKGLHFLVIDGKSYTVYFNGNAPRKIKVRGENFDRGYSVRLAICLPKDTERFEFSKKSMTEVFSVADVDKDQTGQSYFWDQIRGLLVVKIASNKTRVNGEKCPGFRCLTFNIVRVGGGDELTNCYEDAYKDGTYNKTEETAIGIPKEISSCVKSPRTGYGAPVDEGSFVSSDFSVMCPVSPTDLGHSTPEYKGCYIDVPTYRDVDQDLQILPNSMTVETCIERCYQMDYAFAALQNGKECRCGGAYGVYGEDVDGCMNACSGKSNQTCGGKSRNSVYSTGNASPPPLAACGKDNKGAVINGTCFYLGEEAVSFFEGQRACVGLGGDLATIASAKVQDQVVKYLRPKKASAWFGLNDVVTKGVYKFMDGTSLGNYSNFESGEHVDTHDFGLLFHQALFHWSDRKGSQKHRYLCQLPISGSIVTPQVCGTNNYGKRIGDGNCYAVINNETNYKDAQYACYTRFGTLAPLSDSATKEDIVEHLYHFGAADTNYWTGEVGENANSFKELRYNAIYSEFSNTPGVKNGAVCLLETVNAQNPCSTAWTQNGNFCYLYTGRSSFSLTETRTICKQGVSDSDIVTIESEAENNFVGNLVRNFSPPSKPSVRLGYQYISATADFNWVDGTVSSYSNWNKNHGVDALHKGECARLLTSSTTFEWRNAKCEGKLSVVCKTPAAS